MKAKHKAKIKQEPSLRPYTTDYGTTKGHCASKESALCSGFVHLVKRGGRHVTIEGPNGKAIGRIRRPGNGFWGIFIEPVGGGRMEYVPNTSTHMDNVAVIKRKAGTE